MTIQEKLAKAKELQGIKKANEQKIRELEKEMFTELNEKYPLLIQRKNNEKNYKESEIMDEIQLLLRSMLKRNEILKVPNHRTDQVYRPHPSYYLTVSHGLKWPRCHSSYNFLPDCYDRKEETDKFKLNGLIYQTNREEIDFSVLKNNKFVDQNKLIKFAEFITEVIGLSQYYFQTDKLLEKKNSQFGDLPGLSEYSDWDDLEKYVQIIDKIESAYSFYVESLQNFLKIQEDFLKHIREYNKPFRIFLELKRVRGETI